MLTMDLRAAGIGHVGIRVRGLALDGRLRLRSRVGGTRVWVRVRISDGATSGA